MARASPGEIFPMDEVFLVEEHKIQAKRKSDLLPNMEIVLRKVKFRKKIDISAFMLPEGEWNH